MPATPLVKSILASASSSSTFIQVKHLDLIQNNNSCYNYYNEQFAQKTQVFSFAKSELSKGLLIVEKDQNNYKQPAVCYSTNFKSISSIATTIQQFPQKLFVIASNGNMNDEELEYVQRELLKLVDDKNQIESLTCNSAFVYVYSGVNNQCSLEINQTNCILNIKYNTIKQIYCKQYNHLQALLVNCNQCNSFDVENDSQIIIHEITIKNNGITTWPQSIQLLSSLSENTIIKSVSPIPSLLPKEQTTIKIEYKAMNSKCKMLLRLATDTGYVFGDTISIIPIPLRNDITRNVKQLNNFSQPTTSVQTYSPPIPKLISGGADTIKMWNYSTYQFIATLQHSNNSSICSVIAWNKERAIGGSSDGDILVWNLINQQLEYTFQKAHTKSVLCLFQFDENTLVSGGNVLKIWNMKTKECMHTLSGHAKSVTCIDKLNNEIIVSGSNDTTIKLWNVKSGECITTISTTHDEKIVTIVVLPNKQQIVSGGEKESLNVWNIQNKQHCTSLSSTSNHLNSVIVMSENQIITSDKCIKIWNTAAWNCELQIENESTVTCVKKINGDIIASGDEKGIIKLWNIKTKQCVAQWEAHPIAILSLFVQ